MNYLIQIIFIIIIAFTSAKAQNEKSYHFLVNGQLEILTSPDELTDFYSSGPGVGLSFEWAISEKWSFVIGGDFSTFSINEKRMKDEILNANYPPEGVEDVTDFSANYSSARKFSFSINSIGRFGNKNSLFVPYFKGGFGITYIGREDIEANWIWYSDRHYDSVDGDKITNLSSMIGFGIGLNHIFAEINYLLVFDDPDNIGLISFKVGISF